MNKITPEHRQQHLAGAAELAKAGKDQPDDLLYSAVGIETEANLAMPDVADRHAAPQFAAARLGAGGVEHAGPQYAELKLADAAFREGDILPKNSPLTSAQGDGAEYPCRAQAEYTPHCSSWRNSTTDGGGAVPPTPRRGRGTHVGSSRSAVQHDRSATVSVARSVGRECPWLAAAG